MNTKLKPLDIVIEVIETIELEVSYQYDDLVFITNNPFIIRFDQKDGSKLYLHFNEDCELAEAIKLEKALILLFKNKDLELIPSPKYKMEPKEGSDEITITFDKSEVLQ